MKREDLFAAIGGLEESLLEENVTELPKRRHYAWVAAIAACAVLGVGALCLPKLLSGGDTLQPAESVDEFHDLLETVEVETTTDIGMQISAMPESIRSLKAEDIAQILVSSHDKGHITLTETQIENFLGLLQGITFYREDPSQDMRYGCSVSYSIATYDGRHVSVTPGGTLTAVDGVYYDTSDTSILEQFAYRAIESDAVDAVISIDPASEEWLNSVYFGSEYPYFVYGDENYCIFSDGMSGLYAFDFNEEALTFVGNIEDTLDKAGVAHGTEGWNGIGFSAIREDGEVQILCTASDLQEDGALNERGFIVDLENRKLIEIRNFELKILDRIAFAYHSPYNRFDFLFGAAPIPLEDGYICFENSGLNNEVLPGEGSHLAMIELRMVRGDVVESWIPFADLAVETRCGLDSIAAQ